MKISILDLLTFMSIIVTITVILISAVLLEGKYNTLSINQKCDDFGFIFDFIGAYYDNNGWQYYKEENNKEISVSCIDIIEEENQKEE